MKTVHVDLNERSYEIKIGSNLPVSEALAEESKGKALIVSDSNVDPLYGDKCQKELQDKGLEVSRAVVPAGEESKSLKMLSELYDKALASGLDRGSVVVALGGGVVGDLAGFMAATYMRGIKLLQIPTSLLAMVDSSVGGKTGVNLSQGKNLVGSFYQPIEVVADLSTLSTLPEREYVSGLAEVVKYGVIWDAQLFKDLESNADKLLNRDLDVLESIVARCCEIKAEVVAVDERESGVRAILNFGHTLGHALEKVLGYGKLLHGEALAIGMVYAAELSIQEKGLSDVDCGRIKDLLAKLGLPVSVDSECSWDDVRQAMATDKKVMQSSIRFVLAEKLGSVIFGHEVDDKTLQEGFVNVCNK